MSVNSVSQKHDHSVRNGLIAGSVGLAGAGATGYATKSILKDGNYTDEFVNTVHNRLLKSDKFYKHEVASLSMMSVDINSPTFLEDFFYVAKENPEIFIDLDPDTTARLRNASKEDWCRFMGDDENLNSLKSICSYLQELNRETYGDKITVGKNSNVTEFLKKSLSDELDDVYDRAAKAFKTDAGEGYKGLIELCKKSVRDVKLKAGAIYGGIAAAVLGIGAYVFTKMTNNK